MTWWQWIEQTRIDLHNLPDTSPDLEARNFFQSFRFHNPRIIKLPDWPAYQWTVESLRIKAGNQMVQAQVGRIIDPEYEVNASNHRGKMTFNQFLDHVEHGQANDVYMTAQNSVEHRSLTSILAPDMRPMPSYLTDYPEMAFLWIGRDTMTPLHHDITHNFMAQIMGRKYVRMVAPEHWRLVDHKQGVHTNIGWLSDEIAADRRIPFLDFWLNPGYGLLLPAGWFHCVQAHETSITAVFTNFIWGNDAHKTFVPIS